MDDASSAPSSSSVIGKESDGNSTGKAGAAARATGAAGAAEAESKSVEGPAAEVRRERRTSSYLARRRFVAEEPLNFRRSGYAQQTRSGGRSYASQRGRELGEAATGGLPVAATAPILCTDRSRRVRSVFKSQDSAQLSTKDGITVNGVLQESH
mmetsp:Transcript_5829/g.6673  ORF Transcript_5829/g.6673 Transcript_5829/m.6673 type:complete len:154 (+) Transcript_5829:59-520(+)